MSSFDMSRIHGALRQLRPHTKLAARELLTRTAKGFVRDVVKITPPASRGVTGGAAKKAGEAAIASDVSRIFEPHQPATYAKLAATAEKVTTREFAHKGAAALGNAEVHILSLSEMAAFHQARRKKNGRVMGPQRGQFASGNAGLNWSRAQDITTGLRKKDLRGLDVGLVTTTDYGKFLKLLQKKVGSLAAGWNAAALWLKAAVPAWVKRHGDRHGSVSFREFSHRQVLTLENAVPFVGDVRGYERRVQHAINSQANKMYREADYLMKKAIRKAGF